MSDEPREPCPTPLSWQQVLEAFRTESTPWQIAGDGAVLRGRTWGEGPPLYFLNGFFEASELFALSIWLLRQEFRCVAFDRTAMDRQRQPSLSGLTADLFATADYHGDRSLSIYAAGFGGLVALNAVVEQPAKIDRLILQNGFARRPLSKGELLLARMGKRIPCSMARVPLFRAIEQNNHRRWFPPFDAGRWDFYLQSIRKTPTRDLAARALLLDGLDLRPMLPRVQQPVLLLRSEGEGRVAEAAHAELAAGLPNAQTEWLHSCGHVPFVTHPHRLAKTVRLFLLNQAAEDEECIIPPTAAASSVSIVPG